eukprot:Plantae.Rhodophyta-Purpureofilum_apyrenoidigerum.ctg29620.p1 GENE.Plantae.Rhodophyta-Purpureofilum_apyrenoidigerum.ctg29620~~Plantae.Rhodophyta-Purpureofilum_apyrenoidigerum.ctg29620.p1  ORF type:complete len:333 (-),score=36.00 Plantae.Rhodophyta-Purpureofilum_apyrenoidigerum.ctg29620:29-1027(-)
MAKRLYVEEYRLWKRNTPFLYEYVVSKALEWPSLTCEWLPDRKWLPDRRKPPGTDYVVQSMLLGTHAPETEQNYLMIADVRIPDLDAQPAEKEGSAENGAIGGNLKSKLHEVEKVEIIQKINHEGEVNRAKSMPQNFYLVATKAPSGQVLVFDTNRHTLKPSVRGVCTPQLRLGGHKREGFGLCWNAVHEGQLLSGSDDALICHYDVLAKKMSDIVDPTGVFTSHQASVNDVAWHYHQAHLFGSVSEDRKLMLWDMRTHNRTKPRHVVQAHEQAVNSLAFNPEIDFLVMTGSSDKSIALWDMRKLDRSLYSLTGHDGGVLQVRSALRQVRSV